MNKKRSLDDTCDIFLSRRRIRSPPINQRAACEFPHQAPMLCAEDAAASPYLLLPRPLELSGLSTTALTAPPAKPLPLPGSSGELHPKPIRLANGRQHVPRPRNPFILFRCDLVHQRKVLPRSDLDDTNISRIAGDLWREMTAAQKKPWIELAAREKARHALLYPDYKYAPAHNGAKGKKGKSDNTYVEGRLPRMVSRTDTASPLQNPKPCRQSERPRPYPQSLPRRRSSSCPPVGAVPVPSQSTLDGWAPALVSQDDMQRRPSSTIMYQSVTSRPVCESIVLPPVDYNSTPQNFEWPGLPQIDPLLLDPVCSLPNPESCVAPHSGFYNDKLEPTFTAGRCDPGFTMQELAELERLAIGTTFTDPFSTLASGPVDPYTFSTAISPFDCSGYSTGSPSSLSSGTFSSN